MSSFTASPAWSPARRGVWLLLAFAVTAVKVPALALSLAPPTGYPRDFFQEWASARNRLNGLAVYTPQDETARRYLGFDWSPSDPNFVRFNGHPPPAVLVIFPLAWLDYATAFLVWNLISLALLVGSVWLVARQIPVLRSAWDVLPLGVLLLGYPLPHHLWQGQINLLLLPLIVGGWAAERSGRPVVAGMLLGAATAIKLFPGYLVLYFLLLGRWRVVVAAVLTFATLTGLSTAVLGPAAYEDYIRQVMPALAPWRSSVGNVSLWAFWSKLFDPALAVVQVRPLWHAPLLARLGALASCATLLALLARAGGRARSAQARDAAFSGAVVAMLLSSPITWNHAFVLLLLPVAVLSLALPCTWPARVPYGGALLVLWNNPHFIGKLFEPKWPNQLGIILPVHSLTFSAFPIYALLVLFALCLVAARARKDVPVKAGPAVA